ncbi:hypothetical protein [Bacillus sp. FJAT-27245]|uniref:hypothetical protein n=1 Tax=Bacillus sp. FJAT-27245 TaxID=1684144 RepID=UPI0006A7636A|nr:hypothetical protein [Bacillus sp. FJAT-27245]
MKKTRLGGISAIVIGLLYLLTVVLVLSAPPGENSVIDHVHYMNRLIAVHYVLGFLGLFGIMAVLAVSNKLEGQTKWSEWYPYTKVMAIIGFAILALNNLRQVGLDHELSHAAVEKGGETLDTIVMAWVGLVELSPQGWIDFGFVGIWIVTVSYFTLKSGGMKLLSVFGFVGGSCFIITVLGNVSGVSFLTMIGMGLGGLAAVPVWFIMMGRVLLKKNSSMEAPLDKRIPLN